MKLRVIAAIVFTGILLSGFLSVSSERIQPFVFKSIPNDADNDGVPDSQDNCDGIDASLFDRNGDGCIDDPIGARHVEYWGIEDMPFVYVIHANGAPNITDGSDFTAIHNAINAWPAILGTDFTVSYGGTVPDGNAAFLDGVSQVTFEDSDYNFGEHVLAVGVASSFTTATEFNGRVYRPGQVVDADMLFNPVKRFKTATQGISGVNIQAVATHEAGHLFGLSHSAVRSSSMFFILPFGLAANSLETEDQVAFLKAYPSTAALASANRIDGTVTNGGNDQPLPGAIVFAIHAATGDTLGCDYTLADGTFTFFGLPDGNYYLAIYPLDGSSPIRGLRPGWINPYVEANAVTLFVPEYWSVGDSKYDDPATRDIVSVSGGATVNDIAIITNIDDLGPVVQSITPEDSDTGVRIDAAMLINFSESIDISTIKKNFRVREAGSGEFIAGHVSILHDDSLITFTPSQPYKFSTEYVCSLKTGLQDKYGNPLASNFVLRYTTQPEPPLSISSLVPSKGVSGSIIVINGKGFSRSLTGRKVIFDGGNTGPVEVPISQVTPNRLVVTVPGGVLTGPVRVIIPPDTSNGITFTLLSPTAIARGYEAGVSLLGGLPRSLTVLPDGTYAYVATTQGASVVTVGPGMDGYLNSEDIAILPGGLDAVDALPNGKRVYGVSRGDSSIHVISSDPEETQQFNRVISTLMVRDEPLGIIIEPTGHRALVPTAGGEIQVWDVQTSSATIWKQIGRLESPDPNLRGKMAIDPAGDRLLALTGAGRMLSFHLGPDTLLAAITVGTDPRDVVIDPAGQRAYVSDGGGTVTVVSLGMIGDAPVLVQDIDASGSLRGMAMTPTGSFIYAANRQFNDINVIDLVEGRATFRSVAATIEIGANPVDIDISPDGFYAFSLVEDTRQLVTTTIGLGPQLKSLSKSAGPVGTRLVLAGSGFGALETDIQVNFPGSGGVLIPVTPDITTGTAIITSVPSGAVSGPVDVAVWTSDVYPPTVAYSNALYFEVLDSVSSDGGLRYAAQIAPGDYVFRLNAAVSPTGDQMALIGRPESIVFLDIDPESQHFHQIVKEVVTSDPVTAPLVIDVAFSPDGKRLFVLDNDNIVLHAIDANRHSATYGNILQSVDVNLEGAPTNLRVSPDGERCVIVNTSILQYIDIFDGELSDVFGIGANIPLAIGLEYHPGGEYVYVMIDGAIHVVDMRSYLPTFGTILTTLPLSKWYSIDGWLDHTPTSLAFTPNGNRCVVSTFNDHVAPPTRVLFTLDTSDPSNPAIVGTHVETFFYLGSYQEYLEISPGGDRVLWHSLVDGFFLFEFTDPDTNLVLVDVDEAGGISNHDFTPDGSRVYSVTQSGSISIYDFFGASLELQQVSGSDQTGVIDEELAAPFRIRVVDALDAPVSGVAVNFELQSNGGYFTATDTTIQVVVTDSNGFAEAQYTVGPSAGSDTILAIAEGLLGSPQVFFAEAVVDPNTLELTFSEILPTPDLSNVSVTTSILTTFNRSVDPLSVADNTFFLHKSGDALHIPVVYGFTSDDSKVSLTPTLPLEYASQYVVEIKDETSGSGVQDDQGGDLADPVISNFITQQPPPLVLSAISPPSATENVMLVLSGTGFDPDPALNTVDFNGVKATPVDGGVDYLKVAVPPTAVSGDLFVETGASTSNKIPFTVIIPTTSPVDEVLATIGTGAATKSVTMNPDGTIAYTLSPEGDKVIPINVANQTTLDPILVGDHPISIAMHPEGTFAYVANYRSNSVSIITVDPDSTDYHRVRTTTIVGTNPIDLVVAPDGDRTYVLNASSNTMSVIDSDNQSQNHHSVLATLGTSAGSRSIVMAPDGSRIYIGTDTGYLVMDADNYGVLATIGTGAASKSVTMAPDGTMLIILTTEGTVLIYNVDPDAGEQENSVLATLGKGSSTSSVTMNPDGTLLYLIQENTNSAIVVALDVIGAVSALESGTEVPPFQVIPTIIDTVTTGQNPAAMAFDPAGSGFAIIVNAGDSTATFLNASSTPSGPLAAAIQVTPRTLHAESRGRWITGSIELPQAFRPEDILLNTVLLNDTLPVVPDKWKICDCNANGIRELVVKFDRVLFQSVMPEGEYVPITITGTAGEKAFVGEDTIRTIRPTVIHPSAVAIPPNQVTTIRWTSPAGYLIDSVDVYWTNNDGENWSCIARGVPDDGALAWLTPNAFFDSCRVMVTLYSDGADLGMGMSPNMFLLAEPVAINLADFTATIEDGTALLQWHTTKERYVNGFHLLRSESEEGLYTRITEELIPSAGDFNGGEYSYTDESVRPNNSYYYKLEEISERGQSQYFGPYRVSYILKFALEQNVPNPFNPSTTIHFTISEDSHVQLSIFDVAGRRIRTLVDEKRRADNYQAKWDGRDENGDPIASGVYFYRIQAGKHIATRKMVLLK